MRHTIIGLLSILLVLVSQRTAAQDIQVETIATDLRNPRGVAVFPDGRLLVVEAGTGAGTSETGGHISVFNDINSDGDYDDPDEREIVRCCVAGYNTLTHFGTGQDEVGGLGDIVLLDDGHVFYTRDNPLDGYVPDGRSHGIAIMGMTPEPEWKRSEIVIRDVTMNSLLYNPDDDSLFVLESGLNRLVVVTMDGTLTSFADFLLLDHMQQSVPAGMAYDPTTGDILVALFSGQIRDYYGTLIAYMPEDAKVVRVNRQTGNVEDEIVGLTTAVDVAVDEDGNIYVVEMATGWAAAVMPRDFPLYDADAPPDAGGYPRFSGRVTMYPADGSESILLVDELDTPTNITYHDGVLYVSTGQGTPGRPIIGKNGRTRIVGELLRIEGFRRDD